MSSNHKLDLLGSRGQAQPTIEMLTPEPSAEKRALPSSPSSSADSKRPRRSPPPASSIPSAPEPGCTSADPDSRPETEGIIHKMQPWHNVPLAVSRTGLKPLLPDMPPSLEMVVGHKVDLAAKGGMVGQEEVGIIGYAGGESLKGVSGIIKQR